MLRCGQMILGEALVCRHLGRGKGKQKHSSLALGQLHVYEMRFYQSVALTAPLQRVDSTKQSLFYTGLISDLLFSDWRWVRGKKQREEYISILNAFIDKKDSYYSIHQIGECLHLFNSYRGLRLRLRVSSE